MPSDELQAELPDAPAFTGYRANFHPAYPERGPYHEDLTRHDPGLFWPFLPLSGQIRPNRGNRGQGGACGNRVSGVRSRIEVEPRLAPGDPGPGIWPPGVCTRGRAGRDGQAGGQRWRHSSARARLGQATRVKAVNSQFNALARGEFTQIKNVLKGAGECGCRSRGQN